MHFVYQRRSWTARIALRTAAGWPDVRPARHSPRAARDRLGGGPDNGNSGGGIYGRRWYRALVDGLNQRSPDAAVKAKFCTGPSSRTRRKIICLGQIPFVREPDTRETPSRAWTNSREGPEFAPEP